MHTNYITHEINHACASRCPPAITAGVSFKSYDTIAMRAKRAHSHESDTGMYVVPMIRMSQRLQRLAHMTVWVQLLQLP